MTNLTLLDIADLSVHSFSSFHILSLLAVEILNP